MTIPSSSLPPANWYPDPQTPGQLRYWDGQRWTQHVHVQQQPVQPAVGFATQPAQAEAFPATTGQFAVVGGAQPATNAAGMQGGTQQGAQAGLQPGELRPGSGQPGVLQAPTPRETEDSGDDAVARTPSALSAGLLGLAAIGVTVLAIYGLGASFASFLPYVGIGLGFFAVLLGFVGRTKAVSGIVTGLAASWWGIGSGFLAIGLCAYEKFSPGELWSMISGLVGS